MDILSGSYSHMERGIEMAGWFQVLWGKPGGKFFPPVTLDGDDSKPLTITAGKKGDIDRICTRPTAVDLNGDGHLDIVSGNFGGTFYVFYGNGQALFPATGEWLKAGGKLAEVPHHSDPFFVDWDGDGDQDMLSGAADGSVHLFTNTGSAKEATFAAPQMLIKGAAESEEMQFGMEHLKRSQGSTRVWAADMNDDGKLDLLVGDSVTLNFPADGLTGAEARKKYAEWQKEEQAVMASFENASADPDGEMEDMSAKWQALYEKLETILNQEMTGFVWVYYQK